MKIILFSRKGIVPRPEDIDKIFGAIEHYGFDYAINKEFAESVEKLISHTIPTEFIYDGERYAFALEPRSVNSILISKD